MKRYGNSHPTRHYTLRSAGKLKHAVNLRICASWLEHFVQRHPQKDPSLRPRGSKRQHKTSPRVMAPHGGSADVKSKLTVRLRTDSRKSHKPGSSVKIKSTVNSCTTCPFSRAVRQLYACSSALERLPLPDWGRALLGRQKSCSRAWLDDDCGNTPAQMAFLIARRKIGEMMTIGRPALATAGRSHTPVPRIYPV